jgi:hypothetical protein
MIGEFGARNSSPDGTFPLRDLRLRGLPTAAKVNFVQGICMLVKTPGLIAFLLCS